MSSTTTLRAREPYDTLADFRSPVAAHQLLARKSAEFYTGIAKILQAQHEPHVQLLRDLHREQERLRRSDGSPFSHDSRVIWELLVTIEQPDHADWCAAMQELDCVPRSWTMDYTGLALTATEDYLTDMWYTEHDDDLPSEPEAWGESMAALRAEHIEPVETEFWQISDDIKVLLHRLRAVLNSQCAHYARF